MIVVTFSEWMTDALVGRTSDGSKAYVTVAVYDRSGPYQTVNHELRDGQYREIAISCLIVEKGRRNASAVGQCLDVLDDITKPAAPFTMSDVRALVRIWRAWHLNGTRAGCAHVPEPLWETDLRYGYKRVDLENTPPCPETGYRYGHAWLVRELPADGTGTVEGDPLAVLRHITSKSPQQRYAGE